MIKLLGVQLSPYVRKVAIALTAKSLDYTQDPIFPGDNSAEFRAVSPLGKIPVLLDGDDSIPDSSVICEYLDDQYPEIPMRPATASQRARARFLEEFGDSKLIEASAPIFIENYANPKIFGKDTDSDRVERSISELLPPLLDYLEQNVPAEGFLFDHFCTADISIVSPLFNARLGGYEVDAQRWPNYASYSRRVESYGPVAKVRAEEKAMVEKMEGR